ncbi:hypothetical protein M569_17405 [Genlisea aurea]|uniref:Leucine-rich repeat-containing N-terminal plant-type domain-containing protein n=1 Tax=Genlisea aurea TaxID=192259 RepID=S8DDK7_9LAMI|nr:hypothetical protein M569_17405 [Genlisea aurea]
MASLFLLCLGFLVLLGGHGVWTDSGMEEEELFGLLQVMGSLLEDPTWAEQHSSPCAETPWPGIECEVSEGSSVFHVTKIHISPEIVDPPCKSTAKLSEWVGSLRFLKTLSLIKCFSVSPFRLTDGVVEAISGVEVLALESNPSLGGGIPAAISALKNLRILCLSQNNLTGVIPPEIGKLSNLEQLDLSHNALEGRIPERIGGWRNLGILDLSWNVLESSIPPRIGELESLEKIDLSSNNLQGEIPASLGELKRLTLLDLSRNSLSGRIPETLQNLNQLQYLILEQNPLNTTVPSFLGSLPLLRVASFSGCQLSGEIPASTLSGLTNLTALSLDDNCLSGELPPEIWRLENLNTLNLSRNHLTGEVSPPPEFMVRLGERLDVRENRGLCTGEESVSKLLQIPSCSSKPVFTTNATREGGDDRSRRIDDDDDNLKPKFYTGGTSKDPPAKFYPPLLLLRYLCSVNVFLLLLT